MAKHTRKVTIAEIPPSWSHAVTIPAASSDVPASNLASVIQPDPHWLQAASVLTQAGAPRHAVYFWKGLAGLYHGLLLLLLVFLSPIMLLGWVLTRTAPRGPK